MRKDKGLWVNGEEANGIGLSLAQLVASRGIDPARRGLALALNGEVVTKGQWAGVKLSSGDRVEILQPLAGG